MKTDISEKGFFSEVILFHAVREAEYPVMRARES
jgi:hypothetical protein